MSAPKEHTTRIALIGSGQHMQNILLPMIRLQPNVRITSVASKSVHNAEALAKKWDIPRTEAQWQNLINNEIDAIICSGPVELHEAVAIHCVENKIPLFVEKPITRNLLGLNEIQNHSKAAGNFIQVGYNLRFSESINVIKNSISEKNINKIEINYHTNKPQQPLWNLNSLVESFLLAIAVHPLNTAYHLLGKIKKINQLVTTIENNRINIKVELLHQNQMFSEVNISNTTDKFDMNIKGLADTELKLFMPNLLEVCELSAEQTAHTIYKQSPLKPINLASGYLQQFTHFFEDLRNNKATSKSDISDSIWMYELFEKILKDES